MLTSVSGIPTRTEEFGPSLFLSLRYSPSPMHTLTRYYFTSTLVDRTPLHQVSSDTDESWTGDEAETARRASAPNPTNIVEDTQPTSELMGFQALGVVMGPLMLGTLIDQLDPALVPDHEVAARKSIDSGQKGDKKSEKKQKRASLSNKLDRDVALSTHVERANLTANIMELLLIIWRDVVVQLQQLQSEGISTSFSGADKQVKKIESGASSIRHLANSEEELFFMNVIRSRPSRVDFSGEFKVKKKVKVKRSARGHGLRRTSSMTPDSPVTVTSSAELPVKVEGPLPVDAAASNDTVRIVNRSRSGTAETFANVAPEAANGLVEGQRTKSEVAMAEMSMGTILPRLQDSPITPHHKGMLRSLSQPQKPKMEPPTPKHDRSISDAPSAEPQDVHERQDIPQRPREMSHSSLEKPLPLVGSAQRAELNQPARRESSESSAKDTIDDFPARKSSLSADKALQSISLRRSSRRPSEGSATLRAETPGNIREVSPQIALEEPTQTTDCKNIPLIFTERYYLIISANVWGKYQSCWATGKLTHFTLIFYPL